MLNAAVISAIESIAPAYYQESWDNTGVQVGSLRADCTGVLLCVDVTPAVVEEAHELNCSLIVSHHPLLFKGLKRITGNTPVEQSVALAIKWDICIYSCHTAVDSTPGGVSYRMAEMLGAKPMKVLSPLRGINVKVTILTDESAIDTAISVVDELSATGSPISITDSTIAKSDTNADDPFNTTTIELKPCKLIHAVIADANIATLHDNLYQAIGHSLKSFTIQGVENCEGTTGLGVYALLEGNISARQLVEKVKKTFGSPIARCTTLPDDDVNIHRIAICGGSGSEFISTALKMGAQAIITSDTRYHDFVDYQNDILIIDIGHFESEECTKQIFYDAVREKFPNFACYKSQIEENPIKYI